MPYGIVGHTGADAMFTRSLENGERFKLHRISTGSGRTVYALKDLGHDRAVIVQGRGAALLEMVVSAFAGSSGPFEADEVLARVWDTVSNLADAA